jgi:ABC-type taurine transport system substrate-binding protein
MLQSWPLSERRRRRDVELAQACWSSTAKSVAAFVHLVADADTLVRKTAHDFFSALPAKSKAADACRLSAPATLDDRRFDRGAGVGRAQADRSRRHRHGDAHAQSARTAAQGRRRLRTRRTGPAC